MAARIVAAADAQRSVRYTESIGLDLTGGAITVTDVGTESGMARMRGTNGSRFEIRLVAGTVYVKSNNRPVIAWDEAPADLGITEAQEKRYAGRWISIPRSDKVYARLADGLTLPSLIDDVMLPGRLNLERKSRGLVVLVSRGTGSFGGDRSLTAHARGPRLPISTDTFIGYGNGDGGTFSRWNEPLHIHAPAGSTPIATVRRS